jgi:hypothetical protein
MATNTTYMNLIKPELTDVADIASINTNMDTIDAKLGLIEAGAEVNVNADWNASSGDAQILNKPTIPDAVTVVDNLTSTSTTSALSAKQGKVLQDSKATKNLYTATLPYTSWTGSVAPFTKAVTVSGILATDTPLIDIVPSGTYATDVTMETNWANIYRMVTSANTITFYAHAVPTADIPLQILAVR